MNYLLSFLDLKSIYQIGYKVQDYDLNSRNAFIRYLSHYRKQNYKRYIYQKTHNVTDFVSKAAQNWRKMEREDQKQYYCDAKKQKYIYFSRNKRFNRVMKHVRKLFNYPVTKNCNQDINELKLTVYILQGWKTNVLKNV